MIEEDCNVVVNVSPTIKSDAKPRMTTEDTLQSVCEQDYTENNTTSELYNIRQSIDSSSVERNSIFRSKSPPNRSKLSKHRFYQLQAIDAIRKTRSTALPAIQLAHDNWQARGEIASSPVLANNGRKNDNYDGEIDENQRRHQRARLNRLAICYDNVKWICVFLNCVILILSFLYFGSAVAFSVISDILLLIMKKNNFVLLLISFYSISIILWTVSLSGLYILWKMTREIKIHAVLTLVLGIVLVSMVFFQNSTQKEIEDNVKSQLTSSPTLYIDDYSKGSWDYFHHTFKCCGFTGFMDWCYKGDVHSKINISNTQRYLGSYVCSIPSSCCTNSENENLYLSKNGTCIDLLQSKRMHHLGCATALKREVHHLGIMYKIITSGAAVASILLSITSMGLYYF